MKSIAFLYMIIFLFGCAAQSKLIEINYQYVDNIKEGRVDLSFKNNSNYTVCLTPEDWPNKGHKINQASNEVFLVVGDKKFPIQDFNTGYCPKGCEIYVKPGEQISANLPYGEFDLPESLYSEKKILDFKPYGQKCK